MTSPEPLTTPDRYYSVTLRPTGRSLAPGAEIVVPGDKSIAHRAAMFAGLLHGDSEIAHFPAGQDNQATIRMMEALGARFSTRSGPNGEPVLDVTGIGGQATGDAGTIDCGNSGTTARIGMGMIAGLGARATLDGDDSLRRRPMRRITHLLQDMGATFSGKQDPDPDHLPITIENRATGPYRGQIAKASAQMKSAILMAALTAGTTAEILEPAPSRDHTENLIRWLFGEATVTQQDGCVSLSKRGDWPRGRQFTVPGDPSSAAFWAAIALLTGSGVRLPGLCWNNDRIGFFDAINEMGVTLEIEPVASEPEHIVHLDIGGGIDRGIEVSGPDIVRTIDELPLLAAMGLFIPDGQQIEIRDASELRVKESDRIEATSKLISAFGGDVETFDDGLVSGPCRERFPASVHVDSCHDHRIAMVAAVCALGAGPDTVTTISGAQVADVSYPGFWSLLYETGLADVAFDPV